MATASNTDDRQIGRIQRKGGWLYVIPSTFNRTDLGAQESRNSLFLNYGIDPPDLQDHCNSYGAEFFIFHNLNCNKVGLITVCPNKLHDGVANLAGKAFTPTHVCDNHEFFIPKARGYCRRTRRDEQLSPNPRPLDTG